MTNRASVSRQSVDQLLRDSAQCLTALPVQISQNPQPGRRRSTQKAVSLHQNRFFPHSRGAYRSRKAARPAADHRHITGFCLNFFHLDTVFLCIEFKFAETSVPSLAKTRFGYKDATASPQGILRVPRRPAAMPGQQTDFLIARYGEAAQQKFGWCSLALCPTTVAGRS